MTTSLDSPLFSSTQKPLDLPWLRISKDRSGHSFASTMALLKSEDTNPLAFG